MSEDSLTYFIATFLIIAIGVGILALMSMGGQKRRGLDTEWYHEQWAGLEAQSKDGNAGAMLAVVNADKLLDKAMRDRGFKGETMGERLKKHATSFSDINAIWSAHKLRNRIAHDTGVKLTQTEIERALSQFKAGLKNLGAL